jgi:two-component system, NarL family, sensor histidine kinase UhpB
MTGLTRAYDPAAVEALLAATRPDPLAEDTHVRLHDLLLAATGALGARVGVVQAIDEGSVAFQVAASVGLAREEAAALDHSLAAGLAGRTLAEGAELEVEGEALAGLLPAVPATRGLQHALALPVRARDRALGVVWAADDGRLQDDPIRRHAARSAAERIGFLLEQGRLYEALERVMAQILESDERLLGRIGLDIHDGPTQALSVSLLELQLMEAELNDAEASGVALPDGLRPGLERIYETLGGALHEMRELIGHLRPAQFEHRRLPDILEDAVTAYEARSGGEAEYLAEGEFPEDGVSITQKITFYRILQETLNNAHRHGRATKVRVTLVEGPAGISLEVVDDGRGFDPQRVQRPRPDMPQARFGVYGMRDRAQLLGGSFEIRSAPGDGTAVRVFLPRWTPPARPDDLPAVGG